MTAYLDLRRVEQALREHAGSRPQRAQDVQIFLRAAAGETKALIAADPALGLSLAEVRNAIRRVRRALKGRFGESHEGRQL